MPGNALRRALEPAIRRIMHLYWRISRPMTLGARAAVFDPQGRVFLIRHSYVDGWHFPGGGVEAGETTVTALTRELMEEGNIALTAAPQLHGIFFNGHVSRRDHVALYVVHDFQQVSPPVPNREIVAHGFFPPDALPPGATRATRARLQEILSGTSPAERW
jgi:8-oxo-dGTP pyrophosphatase MutT (NUDIX family)